MANHSQSFKTLQRTPAKPISIHCHPFCALLLPTYEVSYVEKSEKYETGDPKE
jgi:hypothetical protein